MKQFMDEMRETLTYMFALFMGGLILAAFLFPCFL